MAEIPDPRKTPLIVVDIANIREMRPGRTLKVLRKNVEEEVFDLEVVFLVMRALERLSNGIPIIYVMDKGIKPHFPNEELDLRFLNHQKKDPRNEGKILLTKSKFRNGDVKTTKADEVICKLHNNFGAIVISRDRFGTEISSGLMQHPETLRHFRPRWDQGAGEIYFENFGPCESKRTLQELCYSLTPVVGIRGLALALIHRSLDSESRRQKNPKQRTSRARETETEYSDYEPDWQRYNEPDVRVTFNPFSKLTQGYVRKTSPVDEPQKQYGVPVRMFEFSQQERTASSGKRVNVIGRILNTSDGRSYLSWFGSTVPIFLETPQPLNSENFVSVFGVLRGKDGVWRLDEVDTVTIVSQSEALNSGRKSTKQRRFATSYLPWGIRQSNRRVMHTATSKVDSSLIEMREKVLDSVVTEETPPVHLINTEPASTSPASESSSRNGIPPTNVPTTFSPGSGTQIGNSQKIGTTEDEQENEDSSTAVLKRDTPVSQRNSPIIRPVHGAVAIAIVVLAALIVFLV
jgi:hypothetical protein